MELKIELSATVGVVLIVMMLWLLLLYVLVSNSHEPVIGVYQNCTCPKDSFPSYWSIHPNYSQHCCYPAECYENISNMPTDCDCTYPSWCGEWYC